MSTFETQPSVQPQTPPRALPVDRPVTVSAAVGIAVGAAFLNIIGAIALLSAGIDAVRDQIANNPTFGGPAIDPNTVDTTSTRAQSLLTTFSGLAYSNIFWSLVLVALAFFALRAGRTTRILATVILVITALTRLSDVVLSVPTVTLIADVVTGLLAVLAIVLFFMRSSNEYGRSRRTGTPAQ